MEAIEDVLDLYGEPYDPNRPVVCFDETSTQLLAETRAPLLAGPGRPRREDYEYVRAGTCNLFLSCEPKAVLRQAQEASGGGGPCRASPIKCAGWWMRLIRMSR